ncbi:MAG: pyrroline-5-carboxylate reductase [Oscillospiraceae bacterium]|nr:pyrroline-5-carboxylate reductase [Oscillospiraceae bacterium]
MQGKIGFVGMGSMAQAILKGWKSTALFAEDQFAAYAPNQEKLRKNAKEIGFEPYSDLPSLMRDCNTLIVACKPDQVERALGGVKEQLAGKTLISIAALWTFERYAELLGDGVRVQFVMPNTPAMAKAGMFLFEDNNSLLPEELDAVKQWFSSIGEVEVIPTKLMGIASCIAGSAPAFVDMMMEGLSDAAVSCGMPRDMSYRLIAQMVVGSGRLLQESGEHPGALKDAVCSPGGSTILGVEALDKAGFRAACQEAVHATMKRT